MRDWRQRRRLSQLDLALDAGVSARHLSFVETGRAQPERGDGAPPGRRSSRCRCASATGCCSPPATRPSTRAAARRSRDGAGRATRSSWCSTATSRTRRSSWTAHWNLVAGQPAVALLIDGVAPELLEPPVNMLRLSLHPDGLAPRIANLAEWRAPLLERLARQVAASGDAELDRLLAELRELPGARARSAAGAARPRGRDRRRPPPAHRGRRRARLLQHHATFGTAIDITSPSSRSRPSSRPTPRRLPHSHPYLESNCEPYLRVRPWRRKQSRR